MEPVDLTPIEQAVMQLMAHGVTRETIAEKIKLRQNGELRSISPATIARAARSAADKVGVETIQHAVSVLISRGQISVRHGHQEGTAYETAIAWLDMRMHSCVSLREFQELRAAWVAMRAASTEES